jgi:hypothetical protein
MGKTLLDRLAEKYPFLTVCTYAGDEYVGIIQNQDATVTTIYDFGSIIQQDEKELFLELANIWWWESNKDLDILQGPVCSLADIAKKRSKRRSITLVRRVD